MNDVSFLGLPLPVLRDKLPVRGHRGIDVNDPEETWAILNDQPVLYQKADIGGDLSSSTHQRETTPLPGRWRGEIALGLAMLKEQNARQYIDPPASSHHAEDMPLPREP